MRTTKGRLLAGLLGVAAALSITTTAVMAQDDGGPEPPPVSGQTVHPGSSFDPAEVGGAPVVARDAIAADAVAPGIGTLKFVPITPCRAVDTRLNGQPKLTANVSEDFETQGNMTAQGGPAASCPGLSSLAVAIGVNYAITQQDGPGFAKAWPEGTAEPATSVINYADLSTSNGGVLALGTGDEVRVESSRQTHFILDITGYYLPEIYGTIAFNGVVQAGDSLVDFVLWDAANPGVYTVDFGVFVNGCVPNVTPRFDQYETYAFLNTTAGENDQVIVDVEVPNDSGTLGAQSNADFHISMTC